MLFPKSGKNTKCDWKCLTIYWLEINLSISSPYYGITNRQSYIRKVLSRYLHSPGSHQSTRFNSVIHWLTDSLTLSLQERLVTLKIIERFRVALDSIHNLCNVHIKKKNSIWKMTSYIFTSGTLYLPERAGVGFQIPLTSVPGKNGNFSPTKLPKVRGGGWFNHRG